MNLQIYEYDLRIKQYYFQAFDTKNEGVSQ